MKLNLIKKQLESSLSLLWKNDDYIIKKNCNERSIAHHLAVYLKNKFKGYDVDCEYNVNFMSDSGRKEIYVFENELINYRKKN